VIEREARKKVRRARRRTERERIAAVVRTLNETLMARDPETAEHSKRVADLARGFGRFLGFPRDEVRSLHVAGQLHDIGKVGVRDAVLLKPGSLTPEEQRRVREHPRIAEKILSPLGLRKVVRYIAVHHENVDGSGYPDGLRGEEIPLAGRALAIVDTYDALRSRRPYKEPLSEAEIRTTMREMAGGKLAPELLEKFWRFLSGLRETAVAGGGRDRGDMHNRLPAYVDSSEERDVLAHSIRSRTSRGVVLPSSMPVGPLESAHAEVRVRSRNGTRRVRLPRFDPNVADGSTLLDEGASGEGFEGGQTGAQVVDGDVDDLREAVELALPEELHDRRVFQEGAHDAAVDGGDGRIARVGGFAAQHGEGSARVLREVEPHQLGVGNQTLQFAEFPLALQFLELPEEHHGAPPTENPTEPIMKQAVQLAMGSSGVSWYATPRTKATVRVWR